MELLACVDVGGTFTDLHVVDQDGETNSFKVSSTSETPTEGIFNVLDQAADYYGVATKELLGDITSFTHGTTVGTNAIIEDETDKTALITTKGFRDTLWLREGGKENPYNYQVDYPDPYISRKLTFGVDERINAEGDVVTSLDEDQACETIRKIKKLEVDAVAVALFWSQVNPSHEQRIGELIDEIAPEVEYSLSHEVNPIIREYRRTSSTAIDASLRKTMESYISNLETELEGNNLKAEPLILASNGGVLPMDQAAENPVWTVDSGPTLLPVGVHRLLEMDMGEDNIVAVDMGGTSLDIGVVKEGKVPRTREAKIGDDFMLGIDKVDVRSVGAGGGSIAWIDEGGLLHIGPQSSGSDPGPICYQRGGNQPTVTDAVISLGYYNEDYFLGGEMDVSRQAALDGIEEELSQDLGVDTIEAAYSVYKTTIQNIVQGLQDMTLERGIDPRNYVLSGGGGALGAFAVPVARELDIEEIYLPKDAGVVSSIGGVLTDIKKDFSASYYTRHSEFDLEKVNSILASLESDAETFFETMEIPERDRTFKFYSEARYENQVWDLEIEIPSHANDSGISLTEDDLPEIEERFHQVHEDTHGFRAPDEIEFLNWRLEGIGQTQTPEFNVSDGLQSEDVDNAKVGERDAYFDREMVPTPVYRTNQLSPGHSLEGPAIVEEKTHTLVLPPESELEITEFNNFYINP